MIRNISFLILGIAVLFLTYKKVKKRLFSEKESFFWIMGAILIILSPWLIPFLDFFAYKIGIKYPPSLLFIILNLFSLFLIFRISQQIYIQHERIKELGQLISILNKQLSEINYKNNLE